MNELYNQLKASHKEKAAILKKRYNFYSIIRLLVALIFLAGLYFYNETSSSVLLICLFLLAGIFLFLLKIHQFISWNKKLEEELVQVNDEEIEFIRDDQYAFGDGSEFIEPSHAFSYDLDFFGKHSLYHYLNRTVTFLGNGKLATSLTNQLPADAILSTQGAIKELATSVEWRQKIIALARLKKDNQESYQQLMDWAGNPADRVPKLIKVASYLFPLLLLASFGSYLITESVLVGNFILILFVINLLFTGTHINKIRKEIVPSTEIDKILDQYGLIIQEIEQKNFEHPHLKDLQKDLLTNDSQASKKIKRLSKLFTRMDHFQNIFGGPVLNGLFQYHIHQLGALYEWKNKHAGDINKWLGVIAKFESLNSISNFAFNNPDYSFPEINSELSIQFNDLGHPLIRKEKRITNSVSFEQHRFFVLTGSNMSGKSTFLRTLGVNMVLAGIGSPICATYGKVHPLPVLVSMRLSDSLDESESYFFAEVKRLKEIMDAITRIPGFVLLDEILRGTNSDDKRTGTIEVIKKMVGKDVYGAIATHDLEVCKTTDDYPETLANYCFEVETIDDELVFDYKLREGICRNKSATFLMKKLEVI